VSDLLARIRGALGVTGRDSERRQRVAERLAAPPNAAAPARREKDRDALMGEFRERLLAQHASTETVADWPDAPARIAAYLAERGMGERAVIAPSLSGLDWSPLSVDARPPEAQDPVGISRAALGVAETGSLVLASLAEEPTSLAFVTATHIALVGADEIVGPLEAVWAYQRRAFSHGPPRTLTLVAGPSRTADIEQTMVFGAHGPERLHVVIVEGA